VGGGFFLPTHTPPPLLSFLKFIYLSIYWNDG
jgi:hypothetical protein